MFRRSFNLLIVIVLFPLPVRAQAFTDSVVKVFVTSNSMDYYQPWQSHGIKSGTGSGSIIKGDKILTNAHVVADHTFIQVKKNNDSRKYTAKVDAIGNDCDLAILSVEDSEFFKNTAPINFGDLPKLQDEVTVLGFPQGGDKLSITEGVVSRIEVTPYAQSSRRLLTVQIDAAINPGNSGGPVLQSGKLVGVAMQAFQSSQNIGYMIPIPVINHFLDDLKDGNYAGFPIAGIDFTSTENKTLRKYYQIDKLNGGVLITRVLPFSPADGVIREGDIILNVDGINIGEDGTFEFRKDERLSMPYLFTQHQLGSDIKIQLIRDGKPLSIDLMLKSFTPLIPDPNAFLKPPYYIYGGLVFTVLSADLLQEWGPEWWNEAPLDFQYHILGAGQMNKKAKKEVVVLLSVLSDDINIGYHGFGNDIVEKVNGKEINSFKEFVMFLEDKKNAVYTIIDFESLSRIVLDNNNIDAVNQKIMERNNIPQKYSDDVKSWINSTKDQK